MSVFNNVNNNVNNNNVDNVQQILDDMNAYIHNKWGNKCQTETYFSHVLHTRLNNIKESLQTTICLTQENINEGHLRTISECTWITSLELYDCICLIGKLDFLKNLTALRYLHLPFSNLCNDDIEIIKYLPNLIYLDLHCNPDLTVDIENYIQIHPTLSTYRLEYLNNITVDKNIL